MTYPPQPTQSSERQIEAYLSSLRKHLAPITVADREEILREIAAHIRDSAEESGAPAEAILARLGPPEDLAAQYRDGLLIHRASRSFSPVLLLRATLRIASKGVAGVLVFFCGVFGYCFGIGLFLTGVIKPFFPAYTGMWFLHGHFVASGVQGFKPQPPMHEVLGWYYIPVAFFIGSAIVALTTLLIRSFLRLSRRWQTILGAPGTAAKAAEVTP